MSKSNKKEYKYQLSNNNQNNSLQVCDDKTIKPDPFVNQLQSTVPTTSASPSSPSTSSSSLLLSTVPPPQSPHPRPLPRQNSLQQQFVEEIDYDEIDIEQVVGKGSFGVVWKGVWRGRNVAIKHINTEGERRAFAVEVRQLSRVSHPNIVQLYGACTEDPVCLVMEYAEGGSLYNVLHCEPKPRYSAGHAISWTLQCARGVAYLHNMKPKPLIHRDLKPPNLLLVLGGLTLKICDFGTACDLNSYMTNNKGSAAWMAPEVFEGCRYTEKCDVFSWGVIFWEVLARRKPFDDIGGSAYRIMWAVHVGQRPPLIQGCPKPMEDLITRCWTKNPDKRPAMDEIVEKMNLLSEFFIANLEPLEYTNTLSPDEYLYNDEQSNNNTVDVTWNSSQINADLSANYGDNNNQNADYRLRNIYDQSLQFHDPSNPDYYLQAQESESTYKDVFNIPHKVEAAVNDEFDGNNERASNLGRNLQPLHIDCDTNAWEYPPSSDSSWELQSKPGLDKMGPKHKKNECSSDNNNLDDIYRLLDSDLRPVTPDNTCQLSLNIFNEHKALAEEFLKVQTEIALVSQYKNDMLKNVRDDGIRQQQELRKLEDEKESLVKLYRNLKRQLEIIGQRRFPPPAGVESSTMTNNIAVDDGWVCVPRRQPQEPSRIS